MNFGWTAFSRYVFLGDVSLEFSTFLLRREFNQKVINFQMEWNNISMQKLQMIYRDFYFFDCLRSL